MVDECSRALVGVGATIAPSSQVWNGICAALVSAASDSRMTGITSSADCVVSAPESSIMPEMVSGMPLTCRYMRPAKNAIPPSMLRMIWVKAFLMASGVRV